MKAHHYPVKIMACGFVITAVHKDPQIAWDAIRAAEAEMRRIENLISSWKTTSETHAINAAAGLVPVKVSEELFALVNRCQKISNLTCGAFDISGNLARYYWDFDKQEHDWLTEHRINELRTLIDYTLIELEPRTRSVFLRKKGMKIGFGGIGKGYAAERAKIIMKAMGIENGLLNASGDLLCWGSPPDASEWHINIPDPRDRSSNLLNLSIEEGSVVTSGSYENYTIVDGVRYSHIINPRTAIPVKDIKNVTVASPNAEFGDALATALSVLPIEEGVGLANRMNGVECIIIDKDDKTYYSNSLNQETYV